MRFRGRDRFVLRIRTKLNTKQAHSKKEWASLHEDFSNDLGDVRDYIDININVSLAKDYE